MTKKADLIKQPFEKNLTELETLLDKLDVGNATLAESLTQFETGMDLVSVCREQLDTAEVTVEKIIARTHKTEA